MKRFCCNMDNDKIFIVISTMTNFCWNMEDDNMFLELGQ